MADTKITALTAITTVDPAADVLPIVDVSDTSMAASGTTKKITTNQILGASGTATLASATISGDLTVATDRLKVNTGSTAVQIGSTTQTQIGTTSWPSDLISKASSRVLIGNLGTTLLWNESSPAIGNASTLYIGAKTGAGATTFGGGYISAGTENASDRSGFLAVSTFQSNGIDRERYRIDSTGVHTWQYVGGVAGTAMTLNATGLGVGVASPSAKLHISGNLKIDGATSEILMATGAERTISASGSSGATALTFKRWDGVSAYVSDVIFNGSGNVGIGVTPKSWLSSYKAIQLGYSTSLSSTTGTDFAGLSSNAYVDSVDSRWERIVSGYATQYYQNAGDGQHIWRIAGTAAADTAITWTNAMTLDASGNLILLSSNTPATLTTNGQLTVNATSNTNLRFSYRGSDGVTRVADITLA